MKTQYVVVRPDLDTIYREFSIDGAEAIVYKD
jgi:hypothetical protein